MENTPLHAQKVTILSRLIKESSLTLEEALVLLKEEEVEQPSTVTTPWINTPGTWPQTITPYYGGTVPLTGTITVSNTGANSFLNTTNTTTGFTQPVLDDLKNAIEDADL